jgi:hypothetical protein
MRVLPVGNDPNHSASRQRAADGRALSFAVNRQHPAKLLHGFSGQRDLGTGFFEKLRGQGLAASIPDLQQALNSGEIVSGGGQTLGELMA